jgi:hypothetical protein
MPSDGGISAIQADPPPPLPVHEPSTEATVLDILWGENRELTGRNQEVWPHAPYVVQS